MDGFVLQDDAAGHCRRLRIVEQCGDRQLFYSKCELPHTPRPIPERCCRPGWSTDLSKGPKRQARQPTYHPEELEHGENKAIPK